MNTPSSPPPPGEQHHSSTESEGSPTRKRSHADMVAGQQGTQHASTIEISSTRSRSEDADDGSPRATPIPSRNPDIPGEELPGSQAQTEEDELDPEQPLVDFDWTELEARYHGAMKERNAEEQELYNEFERLMNFFQMWANTTTFHETDRTFTRLRTRMAHVQHAEDQLEEKRGHYLKVVAAFETFIDSMDDLEHYQPNSSAKANHEPDIVIRHGISVSSHRLVSFARNIQSVTVPQIPPGSPSRCHPSRCTIL